MRIALSTALWTMSWTGDAMGVCANKSGRNSSHTQRLTLITQDAKRTFVQKHISRNPLRRLNRQISKRRLATHLVLRLPRLAPKALPRAPALLLPLQREMQVRQRRPRLPRSPDTSARSSQNTHV